MQVLFLILPIPECFVSRGHNDKQLLGGEEPLKQHVLLLKSNYSNPQRLLVSLSDACIYRKLLRLIHKQCVGILNPLFGCICRWLCGIIEHLADMPGQYEDDMVIDGARGALAVLRPVTNL
jgi:hypothetical protein